MFEGMNQELWSKSSGRMLWMTQPAWPSTMWQILSHDYDTHAAFYGVKAASEPVHVQMSLADHRLAVVNNTTTAIAGAQLRVRILDPAGEVLSDETERVDAAPNAVTLAATPRIEAGRAAIVRLDLTAADGAVLSRNLYWLGGDTGRQALSTMAAQPVALKARPAQPDDGEAVVAVELVNDGRAPALNAKLTLVDGKGRRILPAYYSDNYVSLLPGERRTVEIRYPGKAVAGAKLQLRGWNVRPAAVAVR